LVDGALGVQMQRSGNFQRVLPCADMSTSYLPWMVKNRNCLIAQWCDAELTEQILLQELQQRMTNSDSEQQPCSNGSSCHEYLVSDAAPLHNNNDETDQDQEEEDQEDEQDCSDCNDESYS
jgi:hypothetical protein